MAHLGPHNFPHNVPDIAVDFGQVDHSAHAGDEGDQGLWWDIAVHDNTFKYVEALEDLLVTVVVTADLSQSH